MAHVLVQITGSDGKRDMAPVTPRASGKDVILKSSDKSSSTPSYGVKGVISLP